MQQIVIRTIETQDPGSAQGWIIGVNPPANWSDICSTHLTKKLKYMPELLQWHSDPENAEQHEWLNVVRLFAGFDVEKDIAYVNHCRKGIILMRFGFKNYWVSGFSCGTVINDLCSKMVGITISEHI